MRRILLPIVLATFAFPAVAHASVLSTVSDGTLTITGDADVLPAAGADQMHVADMSGTDVTNVDLLLTLARGTITRDGSLDFVAVDGTNGNDALSVTSGGPYIRTTGLAAITTVGFGEKTRDRLHIDTKLGNDLVGVDPLVHQQLLFTSN